MTSSAQGKRDEATWEAAKKSMKFFGSGYLDIAAAEVHDQQIVQFTKGAEFGYSLARNEANVLVEALKSVRSKWSPSKEIFINGVQFVNELDRIDEIIKAYEKGDV